jgi:hypothetical protein
MKKSLARHEARQASPVRQLDDRSEPAARVAANDLAQIAPADGHAAS